MAEESILCSLEAGVLTITLNRPEVLNSFNADMSKRLIEALTRAKTDAAVRAILLIGAGRAFCAGQDLSEFEQSIKDGEPQQLGKIVRERYNPTIALLREIEKPVIGAVNGVAAGAGANLAFACDIVVASERASFIQSFCKVGLIPDSGGTFFLPRLVGLSRALALTLLGEKLSAAEAQTLGLVYKLFSPENLATEAGALAKQLATQPTAGLGLIKRGLNASLSNTLTEQLVLEEKLQQAAGETDDYREGVLAFLEKREPKFLGK